MTMPTEAALSAKLPFWATIEFAYVRFFTDLGAFFRLSWLWLIVSALVSAVASIRNFPFDVDVAVAAQRGHTPPPMPSDALAWQILDGSLALVAAISLAVAWHRRILLAEQPHNSVGNVASAPFWRYAYYGIIAMLLLAPLLFGWGLIFVPLIHSGPDDPEQAIVVGLATVTASIAYSLVVSRPICAFPGAAIGDATATLQESIRRTKGNALRIGFGLLMATIPVALVLWLLGSIFPAPIFDDKIGALDGTQIEALIRSRSALVAGLAALVSAINLCAVPIGVAFMSQTYRHFFGDPLRRSASAQPTA